MVRIVLQFLNGLGLDLNICCWDSGLGFGLGFRAEGLRQGLQSCPQRASVAASFHSNQADTHDIYSAEMKPAATPAICG